LPGGIRGESLWDGFFAKPGHQRQARVSLYPRWLADRGLRPLQPTLTADLRPKRSTGAGPSGGFALWPDETVSCRPRCATLRVGPHPAASATGL
jgi:hypothetical protein